MLIFKKKIFPRFFLRGHAPLLISYAYVNGPPTSVLVIIIGLMSCAPLEYIVPRLCPGSEIFLALPLVALSRDSIISHLCSARAVTVRQFGHFNRSFYLLTGLPVRDVCGLISVELRLSFSFLGQPPTNC